MPEGSIDVRAPLGSELKPARPRVRVPRLPDQLDIKWGPIETLGRFVLRADQILRRHGIRASLSFDFEEFNVTNQRNRHNEWFGLLPLFLTKYCRLGEENAFWLKGVDEAGETVMAHAIRLYMWQSTTMKREVESLRIMYDIVPQNTAARGEATAPSANIISGRVGIMGALWLHPRYRGAQLASTISPLTRAVALARWYPDYCSSIVFKSGVEKGRAALYGWPAQNVEPAVRFWNLPGWQGPDLDCYLCYRTTSEIEDVVMETVGGMQLESLKSTAGREPMPRATVTTAAGMLTAGAD